MFTIRSTITQSLSTALTSIRSLWGHPLRWIWSCKETCDGMCDGMCDVAAKSRGLVDLAHVRLPKPLEFLCEQLLILSMPSVTTLSILKKTMTPVVVLPSRIDEKSWSYEIISYKHCFAVLLRERNEKMLPARILLWSSQVVPRVSCSHTSWRDYKTAYMTLDRGSRIWILSQDSWSRISITNLSNTHLAALPPSQGWFVGTSGRTIRGCRDDIWWSWSGQHQRSQILARDLWTASQLCWLVSTVLQACLIQHSKKEKCLSLILWLWRCCDACPIIWGIACACTHLEEGSGNCAQNKPCQWPA